MGAGGEELGMCTCWGNECECGAVVLWRENEDMVLMEVEKGRDVVEEWIKVVKGTVGKLKGAGEVLMERRVTEDGEYNEGEDVVKRDDANVLGG